MNHNVSRKWYFWFLGHFHWHGHKNLRIALMMLNFPFYSRRSADSSCSWRLSSGVSTLTDYWLSVWSDNFVHSCIICIYMYVRNLMFEVNSTKLWLSGWAGIERRDSSGSWAGGWKCSTTGVTCNSASTAGGSSSLFEIAGAFTGADCWILVVSDIVSDQSRGRMSILLRIVLQRIMSGRHQITCLIT